MEGMLGTVGPLILMFVLFYFLLIRPQQKRQKAVQQMQSDLKKGDKIVTIGGLHGFVDAIDEDKVVIKCGDGSRLTYDRGAIRDVVESSGDKLAKA
jgi:preprotein translocase subunit YajC